MRTATGEMEPQLFAGYSAPEQYQPESWRGGWTDLYSIAAVTYRVLTGVVVPDAAVRQQQDRLMEPILLDERIPQNISDALYRALSLKPEERFDSMDAFFIAAMLEETTSTRQFYGGAADFDRPNRSSGYGTLSAAGVHRRCCL